MTQGMDEQLARYLSGISTPEEDARLLEACRRDPRVLEELARLVAVDRLIAQGVAGSSNQIFSDEVLCRLTQAPGDGVLADQVTRRIAAEGRQVSSRRLSELALALNKPSAPRARSSGLPSPRAMKIGILSAVAACLLVSTGAFLLIRYQLDQKVQSTVVLRIEPARPGSVPSSRAVESHPSGIEPVLADRSPPAEVVRVEEALAEAAHPPREETSPVVRAAPRRYPVARLHSVVPGMWIERDGEKLAVQAGLDVMEGDVVATRPFELFDPEAITVSDVSPRAQVRYIGEKTAVALGAGTRVRFDRVDGRKHLELQEGRIFCQVAEQRPGMPMQVVSSLARCTVLGTMFWFEAQDRQVRLEVDQGVVQMTDLATKKSVEAVAGQYAELEKEGTLVRGQLPPVDLEGDLLAHWDFEDPLVTLDRTGRHSGSGAGVQRVEGVSGWAARFDGGQAVEIPGLQLPPAFTLSCWVRMPAGGGSISTILANSVAHNSTDGFRWFIHHGNHGPYSVVFETGNGVMRAEGETDPRTSGHVLMPDRWHHLAIRCDQRRREAQIYVDGRPLAIERETEGNFRLSGPFSIGAMLGPSNFFKGQLDELRIYGRLLNEREIHALAGSMADLFGSRP